MYCNMVTTFKTLVYKDKIVGVDKININCIKQKETIYAANYVFDALMYCFTGQKGGIEMYKVNQDDNNYIYHVTFWNGFKILVRPCTDFNEIKAAKHKDILYVTLQNPNDHQKKEITSFIIDYIASFNDVSSFSVNETIRILYSLGYLTFDEFNKFYNREMSFVYYEDDITCESKYGTDIITCIGV